MVNLSKIFIQAAGIFFIALSGNAFWQAVGLDIGFKGSLPTYVHAMGDLIMIMVVGFVVGVVLLALAEYGERKTR